MQRLKAFLVVLLTCAALAAGALLPQAVSYVTDQAKTGELSSVTIQSVELEILSDEQRESKDMMRILSQYGNRNDYPITEDEASMTADEAANAAVEGLRKYEEAGIFLGIEPTYYDVQPYIGISKTDASSYNLFWTVSFVKEDKPYQSVFLHIDDETGKILCIKYELYGSFDTKTAYENEHMIAEKFTEVYFSELGLDDLSMANIQYRDVESVRVSEGTLDGEVLCVEYTFSESEYGGFTMEFYVTGPGGFYVYFPE